MPIRIYPLREEFQIIKRAAELTAWRSPSAFIIRASVDESFRVMREIYTAPNAAELQRQIVLRVIRAGHHSLPDIVEHSGLDLCAAHISLSELVNVGELIKFEPEGRRQNLKLATFKLPE
jgi:hypothetical protein